MSGVGGTGKPFLIEATRHKVASIWKDENSGDTTVLFVLRQAWLPTQ